MAETGRRPAARRAQARRRETRRWLGQPPSLLAVVVFGAAALIAIVPARGAGGERDAASRGSATPFEATAARAGQTAPTPTATPSPGSTTAPGATATATPTATAPPVARLRFVGDVMLARSVGERIERDGPRVVFAAVADELSAADLTIANLECAISDAGSRANKHYTFRAPDIATGALTSAGIDLVSLANNHAVDYGREALVDTLDHLAAAGIAVAGGGRDAAEARAAQVVAVDGLRIAFLGYAGQMVERSGWRTTDGEAGDGRAGIAIGRPEQVARDVKRARAEADVVVVLLHAGIEGSDAPAPVQRAVARAALDAGAALVVGHHPHVLQGSWHADGRLVAWSLGNFVFDGFDGYYGDRANDSAILDVAVSTAGVDTFDWIPVVVEDGLPRPASEREAARIERQIGRSQAP